MKKKERLIFGILILVSLILLGLLLYFVFMPSLTGNVVRGQQTPSSDYQKGYTAAVISLMQQASTCAQVPVYIGNSSMDLIWVDCLTHTVDSVSFTG